MKKAAAKIAEFFASWRGGGRRRRRRKREGTSSGCLIWLTGNVETFITKIMFKSASNQEFYICRNLKWRMRKEDEEEMELKKR